MGNNLELIIGIVIFGLLFFGYIQSLVNRGVKKPKAKAKKKTPVKKKTDTQCFNGICGTIDVLEAELDDYMEKYPTSKHTAKLKRKIKALV